AGQHSYAWLESRHRQFRERLDWIQFPHRLGLGKPRYSELVVLFGAGGCAARDHHRATKPDRRRRNERAFYAFREWYAAADLSVAQRRIARSRRNWNRLPHFKCADQ